MDSQCQKNFNAQRNEHDLKRLFTGSVTNIFNKHLYRHDKYLLLDCMLEAVLVSKFGLTHLDTGREVPTDAEDDIKEFVRIYIGAVETSPAFTDFLSDLYMEVQSSWRGKKPLGEFYTPAAVSVAVSKIAATDIDLTGSEPFTFCDPCIGGGSLALAFLKVILDEHGPKALENISVTGVDISYYGIRIAAAQLLTNLYVHNLVLAELAIVQANSLVMDFESMKVIFHATRRDRFPAADPRQFLLQNKEALAAQAAPTFASYQQRRLDLDAIQTGLVQPKTPKKLACY